MTDKRIDELPAATTVGDSDLFVMQQSGVAKKVTADKIGGGSSAGVVKVGLSYNSSTHSYTSDKTYAQIISAIGSGNNVFAVVNNFFFFNLDYYTGEDDPAPYVEFTRTWAESDGEYQDWYHQRIKITAVSISDEIINNHVVI